MSKIDTIVARIEAAIIGAVKELGPATAAQIERHPAVLEACRTGKLKARHRLVMLTAAGRLQSDKAYQMAKFWLDAKAG